MTGSEVTLGSLEHVVLLAVMRLRNEAYGMTVRREIAGVTGRDLSIGALYATLARLESKGFIRTQAGQPTAKRGGRAKKYVFVTTKGRAALLYTQDTLHKLSAGLGELQES